MNNLKQEIAAVAARMVVEEGLEFGAAKRRALKQMGLPHRTQLPDNDQIEQEVADYVAIFCAETQPAELRALRELALEWMQRLEHFRPHLAGAVWRGTATRNSDIYLQLFCDDTKSAEITLIDMKISYETRTVTGFRGEGVDALSLHAHCKPIDAYVGLHLLIHDFDDLRGALRADSGGRRQRGDIASLRGLLHDGVHD